MAILGKDSVFTDGKKVASEEYVDQRVENNVIESETEPTEGLYNGLMWYRPSTTETKMYLDGQFRSIGGGKLVSFRSTTTLDSEDAYVNINIPEYSFDLDTLLVFQNSVYLHDGEDYIVHPDSSFITKMSGNWNSGTVFNFIVLKNVTDEEIDYFDIGLIPNGSISNDKLSSDAKVGSLSLLNTIDKSSAVNAINEVLASGGGSGQDAIEWAKSFGLGVTGGQTPPNNTLDSTTPTGLYRVDSSTQGRGTNTFAGVALVLSHNDGAKVHLEFRVGGASFWSFIRTSATDGVMSDWIRIATSENAQMYKLTRDTGASLQTNDFTTTPTSFDDITDPGDYYVGQGLSGHPMGSNVNGFLTVRGISTNHIIQIWNTITGTPKRYMRTNYNGWNPWNEIILAENFPAAIADLNDARDSGWYAYSGSTLNHPDLTISGFGNAGMVFVHRGSQNRVTQVAYGQAGLQTARVAVRTAYTGGWGAWEQLLTTGMSLPSHTHSASDINSGTLNAARIPNLPADKITSGTFNSARIPSLDAGIISSGTLADARIPNLNASKITAGTLPVSRGGTGGTSKSTSRRGLGMFLQSGTPTGQHSNDIWVY